ncbi:MAG TPA: hypothetical protein V6D19_12550 [Stenomitos sp.]
MLQVFHAAVYGTSNPHLNRSASLWVSGLTCVVLALNAAGYFHLGLIGALGLIILFLGLGIGGGYWYVASVYLLSQWIPASSQRVNTEGYTTPVISRLAVLQGVWPLILLGPAVSAQQWWSSLGALMTIGVVVGTVFTLAAAIRRAYCVPWVHAWVYWVITVLGSVWVLVGLVGCPIMILLSLKNS